MEESSDKLMQKVFAANPQLISDFLSLTNIHAKVEALYFCDSIQKTFRDAVKKKSEKSEGMK